MTVTQEKYITIEYKFSTPDGTLLGSSEHQGPLTYCAGAGDIIPGLDTRLMGKAMGEKLSFVIPSAEAYGERDESLLKEVNNSELDGTPQVGMRVEAQFGGRWRVATITEVKAESVVLDGNHPLAGSPLHFDCTIVEISDEAPVQSGCGCGGGGCGSGGGCGPEGCSTDGADSSCDCGPGESSGCGCGHSH